MFFIRTENLRQFIRWYPIITTLVIIHLVLFLLTEILSFNDLKYLLIGDNIGVLLNNEYWRLITPIFLHLSITHVLFNTFSLILFGPALERMLGKTKFILTYLAIGITANVATLYLADLFYRHAGASGAIFGLFGLYIYMVFMRKELIDHQSRQIVVVITVIALVMTFIRPGINEYAHLIGFISGLALGPIVLNRVNHIYH